MTKHRPTDVEAAIKTGDKEALRSMGRVGGLTTQKRNRLKRALRAYYAELDRERDEADRGAMRRQANEDIVPLDGDQEPDQ